MNVEVLSILILASVVCVLPGVFLILKKMTMMTDAISHTILLGIVLAFFIVHNLDSPILILGATLVGLATTWFIELLYKSKRVSEDAAIGIVFPLLFGIAVILITLFGKNVHLDIDSVLLGEVVFAPLVRTTIFGISVPTSLLSLSVVLLLNLIFIILFYKELKLSAFDSGFALLAGFSLVFLQYGLMTLVSITSVVAFDVVGSILVIALMVGPGLCARLLSDQLHEMIVESVAIAVFNAVLGYFLAVWFDVSAAGMVATVTGMTFILVALFAPRKGLIVRILNRQSKKQRFETELLLLHLSAHAGEADYAIEAGTKSVMEHLKWSETKTNDKIKELLNAKLITIRANVMYLTEDGQMRAEKIARFYQLPVALERLESIK